jgi:polysaccharide pyruvyl transferase WcaK-like protein
LATILGKKRYLIGQGIGPLQSKFSRWILRALLKSVDGISVRDRPSYDFISAGKVMASRHLIPDLAFYEARVKALAPTKRLAIGVSLRPIENFEALFGSLGLFLGTRKEPVVFLQFQDEDSVVAGKVDGLMRRVSSVVDMTREFVEETESDHSVRVVIGMRYHSCVWASLRNIPFIALSYDDKVKHFAEEMGQPWVDLTRDSVSETDLKGLYDRIESSYDEYRDRLFERVSSHLEAAKAYKKVFV